MRCYLLSGNSYNGHSYPAEEDAPSCCNGTKMTAVNVKERKRLYMEEAIYEHEKNRRKN